ncbi:hypothetical protein M431DRAFT_222578 [Trichoderma harzianum CBS 226.95]|uniref:Uncharacterized protein n=1 Tax=Trichoderma harzianum CBS 226.95 TaxID=983964 RepID=A0A2T4A3C8_TRIHA|nr:hypothetical protein M431DRAFT_222578 [Trichoderma harzianum CBS 226.95]PTB51572.1 hypothetical protein M431DRAFT_222578 [Trichoderma harzianum CBS 226.95]
MCSKGGAKAETAAVPWYEYYTTNFFFFLFFLFSIALLDALLLSPRTAGPRAAYMDDIRASHTQTLAISSMRKARAFRTLCRCIRGCPFPAQGPILQDIPLHAFVLVLAASLYNL